MADQDLDQTLDATPFKLSKAREKGQTAKSIDLVSAIVLLTAVSYVLWRGLIDIREEFELSRAIIARVSELGATSTWLWPHIERMIRLVLLLCLPFFSTIALAAIVGNLIQTGFLLSSEPLKPDTDRMNPVNGFKRIFSMRTLFDGFRACIKLMALLFVGYLSLRTLSSQFFVIAQLSPNGFLVALVNDLTSVGLKVGLALGLIGIIDFAYSNKEFAKKMRMSHREMKDEVKHREGDPRIRGRLKELRREMLARSLALKNTKHADVIITNPTHIAVSLSYKHGDMAAPIVLSKGSGFLAMAIRRIAAKHRIPVVQNPSLAREIYKTLPIAEAIPQEMFSKVAKIIVWVMAMREAKRV
jgi:flagellar biosynthesis protein FlhB